MRITFRLIPLGLTLAIFLAGCNLPASTPNAAATLQAVYTAQAATVQALQTQARSIGRTSTPVPTMNFPTLPPSTALPGQTQQSPSPQPTLTHIPTQTALPTLPFLPTKTALPTRAPVSYCNWAAFVKDISIPDGSLVAPGEQIKKTWRLKNIGTCTWTTSYGLVFLKGNNMNAVATTRIPTTVHPGQNVEISIDLIAPSTNGSYRGYWMLRNKAGEIFGLGPTASDPFYVDIKVSGSLGTALDFAASYCDATWQSGTGLLPCPGEVNSIDGYVILVKDPQLENGQKYHGPGLLMAPENTNRGYLRGVYPPILVRPGDHFRAILNCKYRATGCNAIFRLSYQIGDGPVKILWEHSETYDGSYYSVNTDLSSLEGNYVKFILTVLANGSAEYDKLIWVGPRIERVSTLFTASAAAPTAAVPANPEP